MITNKKSLYALTARLLLAALCAFGGLTLPSFSRAAGAAVNAPDAEVIAFTRDGNIWTMKADGTAQTLVGSVHINGADPQLSPDAKRIAFTCGTELWDICVMDAADGGNLQALTDLRTDTQPAWSPDGTRIAFTSRREGAARLYTMKADGSDQQRLAVNDPALLDESSPAWSPDGTSIAFVGSTEEGTDVYVASADGSGAPARVTSDGGIKNSPAWSPDGTSIAYDTSLSVRAVNVASGLVSTLASAGDENQQPVYSPDGGRIAFYRKTFIRNAEGDIIGKEEDLLVMQADGTGVASLNCPGGYAPDWRAAQATPPPPPPPPSKTPAERVGDLISLVGSFGLHHGTTNSLTVKLRAALAAIEAGDTATACARLSDFVNQTRAQSGKKLSVAQATQLVGEAEAVRAQLGCP